MSGRTKLMRPRWLAWLRAMVTGYFWLDCPTCGRFFAGFESGGPASYHGGGIFTVGCCECSALQYHYELHPDGKGADVVVDGPAKPRT